MYFLCYYYLFTYNSVACANIFIKMWLDMCRFFYHLNGLCVFLILVIYNIALLVGVLEAVHFRSKKSNLWVDTKYAIQTMVDDFYAFREFRQERKEALWDLFLLILGDVTYQLMYLYMYYLEYKEAFIFSYRLLINEEFYTNATKHTLCIFMFTKQILLDFTLILYTKPVINFLFFLSLLFLFSAIYYFFRINSFKVYSFFVSHFLLNENTFFFNFLYFFLFSTPFTALFIYIRAKNVFMGLVREWRWTLLIWWGVFMRGAYWSCYGWYYWHCMFVTIISLLASFYRVGFMRFLNIFSKIAVDVFLLYLFFYWYYLGVPIFFRTGVTSSEIMWYMNRISRPSYFRYLFYWYLLFYENLFFYLNVVFEYLLGICTCVLYIYFMFKFSGFYFFMIFNLTTIFVVFYMLVCRPKLTSKKTVSKTNETQNSDK